MEKYQHTKRLRLIVGAGGKADKIIISPNNNTLKCILDMKDVDY